MEELWKERGRKRGREEGSEPDCQLYLGQCGLTYRSRSIPFSSVDDVESLGTDRSDNMSPLVGLVSISVVSEVSAALRSLWGLTE